MTIENYKNIYFIGIGGISMSALALIMKNKGCEVKGYDRSRSASTEALETQGIKVYYDFDENNCLGCDLVVYTAAVDDTHPEMRAAAKHGIPRITRAALLGSIAGHYENAIAISGTHGKSTTSGLLSQIFLSKASCDPTIIIGAELPSIHSTFRTGHDGNFIFEACEYKDSFLNFYPNIAVILNVEHDHPDYFKDIQQMIGSFRTFLTNTGKDGKAVINYDSFNARIAADGYKGKLFTYSASGDKSADFTPSGITYHNGMAEFDVTYKGEKIYHARLSIPGEHNVSNALAACACAYICGVPAETVEKGLSDFKGVTRRFEFKGKCNGANVFDDYAHHPDEIRATLGAAKRIGAKKTTVVFQPHTFSRLKEFFQGFTQAFGDADEVIFTDVYSAREINVYGVDSEILSKRVKKSRYIKDFGEIAEHLRKNVKDGEIVIIMGAGDIDKLTPMILD